MSELIENENFRLRPIESLKGYNFFVDDYQRGYKWTSQQVIDLLNDINDFDPVTQSFYCLQPLAVKKRDDEETVKLFKDYKKPIYEVIDGQQRLTTIFIIQKIIDKSIYTIKYKTRLASAEFLENIENELSQYCIENLASIEKVIQFEKEVNKLWVDFENDSSINNIDNYHFFVAYLTVKTWFSHNSKVERSDFSAKLNNHTNFIWYEDIKHDNSKKVFRNLNSGKIELTNAELIKALFINSLINDNKEVQRLSQTDLATEWDKIEYTLQHEDFWYFINNETDKNKYQTRIDLLFELLVGKSKQKDDKLHSYRIYAEKYKAKQLDWKEVNNIFLQLKEWFEDRELYHLIGFLIYREFRKINEIISISKDCGKTEFKTKLVDIIKVEFAKKDKDGNSVYDLTNLTYHSDSYDRTTTVLLLFNIVTYQKSEALFRFPFNNFKNEKWSLEHIHAQNAEDFKTTGELKAWIKDINGLLKNWTNDEKSISDALKIETQILERNIENILDEIELTATQKIQFNNLIDKTNDFFQTHSLKNLALLDRNTNSALGNRSFKEKRNDIIEIDQKGWVELKGERSKAFIPLCTKNAFLKYYSSQIIQMEYWGYQDREDYLENINSILEPYFSNSTKKNGQ